jgi:hypothetical protein
VEVLFSAGYPPTNTVGLPGAHGAEVLGTQGAGVKKTGGGRLVAGLATLLHIPNVGMFAIGLLSIIVPVGAEVSTVVWELTTKVEGAVPKLQSILAPAQTQIAIEYTFPFHHLQKEHSPQS